VIVLGLALVALPPALFVYAYLGYPVLLRLLAAARNGAESAGGEAGARDDEVHEWPTVSISLPAHNEESRLARTLEDLLALDYPADRLKIVVVSDASTDRTDAIAQAFSDRGVRLLRMEPRGGKVAAENYAAGRLTGEIVVNTDATIRVPPGSLKPLVRALDDPTVGVASGRDVSVASVEDEANRAESGYVGYEMRVRALETRLGGIVGASGCLYAIRRELHAPPFPAHLSRDFAACLNARENGYRAVSVDEAVCFVPRTGSLQREYRRKVRTMSRGLATLAYKRRLLNPFRYGLFAWMLASHKLARWLVPLSLPVAGAGLLGLAVGGSAAARVAAALASLGVVVGAVAMRLAEQGRARGIVAALGYAFAANVAGLAAWGRFLTRGSEAVWEPTRRD
jgi:cellulose synthase/poly-beta-1,6-N-acetylglucosamine synthase-like glycosyltransferase